MTDLNLNQAQCIRTVSDIGYDTYVNICNGTKEVVNWGTGDWLSSIFLAILIGALTFLILFVVAGLLYLLTEDWRAERRRESAKRKRGW